jgi:uncharacterized Fe-S cluster-containing MiaB family protein
MSLETMIIVAGDNVALSLETMIIVAGNNVHCRWRQYVDCYCCSYVLGYIVIIVM